MLIVVLATGCSANHDPVPATPTSTTSPDSGPFEAKVGSTGVQVAGTLDGVEITASAPSGIADNGTRFTLSPSDAVDIDVPAKVASIAPFDIVLGDGEQPNVPIALTIDLSGSPEFYSSISDSVVPLIAVNADDQKTSDLLSTTWNSATKTVTATTNHLSTFQLFLADAGSALADAFAQARPGRGGTSGEGMSSSQSGAAGEEACSNPNQLTIGKTTYTLTASKSGVITGCLLSVGDAVAVDFSSNSQQFYTVTSRPQAIFSNGTGLLSGTDQIAVWLRGKTGQSGLLTPQGSGTLTFSTVVESAMISLDVDPVALQLETILTGIGMLGIEGDEVVETFETSKAAYDCFFTAYQSASAPAKDTIDDLVGAFGDIAQCGTSGAAAIVGDSESRVLHKIGVAASIFSTLPRQLVANLSGAVGEFSGENHLNFTVTANREAASPIQTGDSVIELETMITSNGFGFTRGTDLYALSNTYNREGRYFADINYHWKLNRSEGTDLGYCRDHVRITASDSSEVAAYTSGPGFNICQGGGAFATNTKVFDPGTYTVSVDVETERGGTFHASRQFTVIDD